MTKTKINRTVPFSPLSPFHLKIRCLHCGKERYLLDEAVGISPRRLVTGGLCERALWLATEMAYDLASLGMHELCGISISDETIKNLVHEEGSKLPRPSVAG